MNLIKPEKLKAGDTLGIIAPAGNVDPEKILMAKEYFENKGYKVKTGQNLFKTNRYMAGSDEERLEDFHCAFLDPEIKAIICARGGYGAIRLINKINYSIIKNNPKIFCGYSDITALSAMIFKNTGLITFSAPMAQSDFSAGKINMYSENEFWKTLSVDKICIKPDKLITYRSGSADGILWGGNLATIVSLCGQDFIPEEKFIFFTEDINEDVYKIDKYFRQLLNIDNFGKKISALVLGDFIGADKEELNALISEIANELNIPVYGGYPFSHSDKKASVPFGGSAKLTDGLLTADY